ncbi:MAG TPA: ABC transporter ATP-binding protein [Jiangellaceae bacterium]|nr:ABC transporter ATP-binding protein [Jiangellaceae bacterium]
MNSSPAIWIEGLRVVRGGHAVLDGFGLQVRSGTLTGLLGPSGSGKSTLMRVIAGVQQVAAGTVEVLGLPAGSAPLRQRVAYVTQAASVYDDLTVRQNLRYFGRVLGANESDMDRAVGLVDLGAHVDTLVGRLSGGERSRVSLAVALLGEPELLVLDEPTVGLDPVLRRDLWALFNRLADQGTTLLVSSHVMDEAERCRRLILLRHGRVLADDTLPGLLERTGERDAGGAFLALVDQAISS